MRILVTNDDGVEAVGLRRLVVNLAQLGHDVIAIAPTTERSGSASAIGPIETGADIALEPVDLGEGIEAYGLDAPPALAVLAAFSGEFGARPQLVVSGVNSGHNLGISTMFSGTVGAALTASALGIPGIAISCGYPPDGRLATAQALAMASVAWLEGNGLPPVALNLNAPDRDLNAIRGIRNVTLAHRGPNVLTMSRDGLLLRIGQRRSTRDEPDHSDTGAVAAGYATVTLLKTVQAANPEDADEFVAGIAEALLALRVGTPEGE